MQGGPSASATVFSASLLIAKNVYNIAKLRDWPKLYDYANCVSAFLLSAAS